MIWKYPLAVHVPRRVPTPTDPVTPAPATTPTGATGLTQHQRDTLAVALHRRWHGEHVTTTEARCAELSGAYDDVAAIEPILLGWIRGAA